MQQLPADPPPMSSWTDSLLPQMVLGNMDIYGVILIGTNVLPRSSILLSYPDGSERNFCCWSSLSQLFFLFFLYMQLIRWSCNWLSPLFWWPRNNSLRRLHINSMSKTFYWSVLPLLPCTQKITRYLLLWHNRTRASVLSINESDGYLPSALWSSQVDPASGCEWRHHYLSSNEVKKLLVLEQHCPVPLKLQLSYIRFRLFSIAKRQFGTLRGVLSKYTTANCKSAHVLQTTHTSFPLPDSSPPRYAPLMQSSVIVSSLAFVVESSLDCSCTHKYLNQRCFWNIYCYLLLF